MSKYFAMFAIAVLLVGSNVFLWDKWVTSKQAKNDAVAQLQDEKNKNKVRVSNSMLSSVSKFTFAEITGEYHYFLDKTFGKLLARDKIKSMYEWSYTFNFGFNVPDHWNWCPKVVDETLGVVAVNAPKISQTNSNPPAPRSMQVFRGANWNKHEVEADAFVTEYARQDMEERAQAYLKNDTIVKSVRLSLGAHLQNAMNANLDGAKPVSKVEVKFVDTSTCG